MGQVYYKLFYHAVWRTKHNLPVITPAIENVLYPLLENKAKRFGCYIHRQKEHHQNNTLNDAMERVEDEREPSRAIVNDDPGQKNHPEG